MLSLYDGVYNYAKSEFVGYHVWRFRYYILPLHRISQKAQTNIMRILLLTICSLFAIIAQSFAATTDDESAAKKGGVYALVTSSDQIVNGGTYIVAGHKKTSGKDEYTLYLMSTKRYNQTYGFAGVTHGLELLDTLDLREEKINVFDVEGDIPIYVPYEYIIERNKSICSLKDTNNFYVTLNSGGILSSTENKDNTKWNLQSAQEDKHQIALSQGSIFLKYTTTFFNKGEKNVSAGVYPLINLYKKSEPVTFTMSPAKYATLYYENEDILLPEGLGAYTITVSIVNDILKPVVGTQYASGDIIPAGTGVVVYGAAGEYQLQKLLKNVHATAPSSSLVGSDNQTSVTPEANYYVLSYKNDDYNTVGFYKATSAFQNGAHKAYLVLNEEVAARLSSLLFKDLDYTTGIQLLTGGTSEKEDAIIYDLNGRSVSKPSKGIYIRNHKKFVIK